MTIDMDFSGFDPTVRRIAEQLAGEALVSPKVLADELRQYVAELDSHKANAEFVDHDVAKRIAGICWKLLEALPDEPEERQHRLTQLAVNYFVLAEDAHDDNYSLAGFEDDLQVVIAVVRELGLEHLIEQ
jgi:uncharacterized membrane protein YkvA (DUF1232 family)